MAQKKSGLIVNDAQITRIFTEEYYDNKNPRFELELFAESKYNFNFTITQKPIPSQPKLYSPIKKGLFNNNLENTSSKIDLTTTKSKKNTTKSQQTDNNKTIPLLKICTICKKNITSDDYVKADSGKTLICKKCFNKLF